MYIGEASKLTGLSVKAIRLYEEKGLIRVPARSGSYRIYSKADIEILNLIAESKRLGVTLASLKNVIVYNENGVDWHRIKLFLQEVKAKLIAERKLIDDRIHLVENCIREI
ncbi:transcriptional regulator [Marinomonas sp. SBI22]|uniref:MerR family transcriptional regulator n=1 Tax=unclassified Marinomonas TaxID=196814 RepID=UPI0007AFCCC4|nr:MULTISPECIES: MerR family transcriptional regulator [unclassified Marinomonas]KZM42429.1 transcriptional regulator [Marinomonas sp. SBI22]KZM43823.1 transcriptional regulator [Marinomonas sp. SBI8L]